MRRIYLDHAAGTPLDPRVREAMEPFLSGEYGNASGFYQEGVRAKKALDESRDSIARILNARASEIIFTSGGTESDNLAIFGIFNAAQKIASAVAGKTPGVKSQKAPGVEEAVIRGHIITTAFEHPAVLEACKELEKAGCEVAYISVGENGIVNPDDIKNALRPETVLVSVMYANNEVGTIQPIAKIGKIIQQYRNKKSETSNFQLLTSNFPYFHTDACQAAGYLDLNVDALGVDLLSANASKIYGPKGAGFLYRRNGVPLNPIIVGGGQEAGMRSGTENIAGIAGVGRALAVASEDRKKESERLIEVRDYFISETVRRIPGAVLNGDPTHRLPNNINFSILGVDGEALVLRLDARGIACSTGSACASQSREPSHVILALGKSREQAQGSVRFTLGRDTTKKEVEYTLDQLSEVVNKKN